MTDFSAIAPHYRRTSTAQRSAAERLFELLDLKPGEAVLDLGCGTGHLTAEIRARTGGFTVGADPSPGMVDEARRGEAGAAGGSGLEFVVASGETLDMPGRFDAVFSNSAVQWFRDVPRALANCRAALRSGGRMAVQAPARSSYCPNFLRAVATLADDPRTAAAWARFRLPWFFRETPEEYAAAFTAAGFVVPLAAIEDQTQTCTPERVLQVFESGAAAAYLNPDCYEGDLPPDYLATAHALIADDFRAQAGKEGLVELTISRVYLLAVRPRAEEAA